MGKKKKQPRDVMTKGLTLGQLNASVGKDQRWRYARPLREGGVYLPIWSSAPLHND